LVKEVLESDLHEALAAIVGALLAVDNEQLCEGNRDGEVRLDSRVIGLVFGRRLSDLLKHVGFLNKLVKLALELNIIWVALDFGFFG
jgi:hypothetical protein